MCRGVWQIIFLSYDRAMCGKIFYRTIVQFIVQFIGLFDNIEQFLERYDKVIASFKTMR